MKEENPCSRLEQQIWMNVRSLDTVLSDLWMKKGSAGLGMMKESVAEEIILVINEVLEDGSEST